MMFADVIGYLAAAVGTSLMLPQVVKTWRSKRVGDLSVWMLWLYFINCALWLAYGVMIAAMPVALCNFVALLISVVQLVMKYRYA